MSVTSCEVDCPGSSNGSDFCCTEEELFESFMEIVNDPELQGLTSNNDENAVDVKKGLSSSTIDVSDEINKDQGLTSEGNNENVCDLIVTNSALKVVDQVEKDDGSNNIDHTETSPQSSLKESHENCTSENGLNGSNNEVLESTDESLSNVENEQDIPLQNDQEMVNIEEISEKTVNEEVETLNDSGIAEHDSSVSLQGQGSIEDSGNVNENDEQDLEANQNNENESIVSTDENEQHAQNCDPTEQSQNEAEELGLEPTPELNQSNTEEIDVLPSHQPTYQSRPEVVSSILLWQPTSPKRIEREDLSSNQQPTSPKTVEPEDSSSNQQPTSPKTTSFQQPTNESKPEIISSNLLRQPISPRRSERHDSSSSLKTSEEVSSTNQNEAGVSSTNQNEAGVSSTNQNELQTITDSIEENIRKTNQVCEELNAITQRLSLSSDELLGDNDSDSQKTDENSLETGVVNNGKLSHNNNIMDSKPDTTSHSIHESDTNNERRSGDNQVSTDVMNHTDILEVDTPAESKRPNSLPKLVVTSQANNSLPPVSAKPIRSPQSTTPCSVEKTTPVTSPPVISPTHMTYLKDEHPDRKASMSDSLDSSEGSLSGDTKSVGASPLEDRGLFNWEILNTALGDAETDEDDGIYESSGSYGGFGLLLDDDSTSTLNVEDVRHRSVSQSSTMSEAKFQEEYIKNHKTASLDRSNDGVLCSGYLFKLGGTGITPKNWRKRWCVLRYDRCLYYYKTARDKIPCGIVVLANYIVSHSSECNKKNCIKISKGGGRTYFFSSDTSRDMLRWMEALRKAAENSEEGTNFVIREEIIHNVAIPALSIKKPDCHGYLTKQGAKSTRSWKRRYCVLKNGCLYYYREMSDTTALGVAKLHGYTVEEVSPHGRRSGFRCVPPNSKMRTFTFIADNEYDKKRWIPCFQESIRANTTTDDN